MRRPPSYHPACLAFPRLPEAELRELAEDIRLHGLLHPVVTYRGQVLDGRNRLLACERAGVPPRFVEWAGGGSPVEWVIATNLTRRHLTGSQRAVVAHDLLPLLREEAKCRQRQSRGRGKKGAKAVATFSGKASEAAARLTRSNSRYVEAVRTLSGTAPELVEPIRSGTLTVPGARRLARLPAPERAEVLRRTGGRPLGSQELAALARTVHVEAQRRRAQAAAPRTGGDQNILLGDMGLLRQRLRDGEVDLFLTDPIHQEVAAYGRLAELASAKLRPGGLCLAYTAHLYLPDVLRVMGEHLAYWWLFAVRVDDQPRRVHIRGIQARWKPVVAFARPPVRPAGCWLSDLVEGGERDHDFHEWGQGEAEAVYLIRRLTDPGSLVVDPYCGGGTVPAACQAAGRRWLATERDRSAALTARKRLRDAVGRPAEA